ncbi:MULTISPECIES: MFS transporter [Streptomyces]|uniref:MFS transporter n=1 Tax=Streptomyces morookaense TaxID=1970 RepID=A0A7Y7B5W9_STRMO|nr:MULTISPECIES: MFS transporter [Streptomyces]MCC2274821.1 MFS transporter [Streptomyces sp. ET3-23]NVK79196.1 MFS transporter [Streptomyces morookaense]GHF27823.1 MFS transporter [Streptomyces morookaense]
MPIAVIALSLSGFAIGVTEFIIAGILPDIGSDLGVSVPTAGLLVSGYALGVVIGAPGLTVLCGRTERKRLLVRLMVLFLAGTLLSALAPNYGVLMAGRVLSAFAHGAYFGVAMVVAADLVPENRKARAVSMVAAGLTMSTILGVPAGTFIGQNFGWRWAFWMVALFGALGLAGIAALVPRTPAPQGTGLRAELGVLRRPQVVLVLLTTVLGFGGVMTSYTYIAEMATEVTGFSSGAVTLIMVLFGVGMFVGNLISGRVADRAPNAAMCGSLALLSIVLGAFTFTVHDKVATCVTVFLFGAATFATISPLQMRIMVKAEGAPTLASASNIAAFNLANAAGPLLGGRIIASGMGYPALNWAGALVTVAGLVLAGIGVAAERTRTAPAPAAPVLSGSSSSN